MWLFLFCRAVLFLLETFSVSAVNQREVLGVSLRQASYPKNSSFPLLTRQAWASAQLRQRVVTWTYRGGWWCYFLLRVDYIGVELTEYVSRTISCCTVSCRVRFNPSSVSELTSREEFDFGAVLPVVFASSAKTCCSNASIASTLCRLVASSPQLRSLRGSTSCSRTRRDPQTRLDSMFAGSMKAVHICLAAGGASVFCCCSCLE